MVSVQSLLDQCRHRTTIVFLNLCRWPDKVKYYEQDYPYTIIFEPNFGVHIPQSFGKTVIVFTSHLDLTRHSSHRRVHKMVGVLGRLGNASRRQRPLAHGGSPTFEVGFGKTRVALA
ncbi:uncharacterized protein TNCV_4693751 [Trichonephila clavipes]|uniref:Uncharacterized protein n=1 Tax=Trichonephila clavipes TaxID=2585209 RepID=A0A8X7BH57_TRICX|nr:uncharacterized protein TNCV_4693751 [Trichonephila clavipes]